MILAKRSHSNPCFWTAVWNPAFYEKFVSDGPRPGDARDQQVFVLNVHANRCFKSKVSNVHVEKGVSVAEITPGDAERFCQRWFPDRFDQFRADMADHPETLYLDFESILTGLEAMIPYQILLEVIRTGRCTTVDQKTHMACFLVIQFLRSSAILQSSIQISERHGRPKFEYYWWLKQILSHADVLFRLTAPVVFAQWHLYRSAAPVFALPDTPILMKPRSIMVALSPHLLLEVLATPETEMERCFRHEPAHKSKIREYRRRAIRNTFKELVCATTQVATDYVETTEWRQRVREIARKKALCDLIMETDATQMDFLRSFLRLDESGARACDGTAKRW